MKYVAAFGIVILTLATGCAQGAHGGADEASAPAPSTSPAPASTPPAGAGTAVEAAGLNFVLPAGWQQQTPSSRMRLAQASISGPGGNGELAVFFFGTGQGGDVESNLARWLGQMEATGEPARHQLEAGGLNVTWVETTGTLKPSQFGMGPKEPVPGSQLFGAVVEGGNGPWFFKATGPEATLGAQRDAWISLLESVSSAG